MGCRCCVGRSSAGTHVKKPADGWDAEGQDAPARSGGPRSVAVASRRRPTDRTAAAARAGAPGIEQADVQARLDRSEWHRALAAGETPSTNRSPLRIVRVSFDGFRRPTTAGDRFDHRGRSIGSPRWRPRPSSLSRQAHGSCGGAPNRCDACADARVAARAAARRVGVLALEPPLLKVSPASLTYRGTEAGRTC